MFAVPGSGWSWSSRCRHTTGRGAGEHVGGRVGSGQGYLNHPGEPEVDRTHTPENREPPDQQPVRHAQADETSDWRQPARVCPPAIAAPGLPALSAAIGQPVSRRRQHWPRGTASRHQRDVGVVDKPFAVLVRTVLPFRAEARPVEILMWDETVPAARIRRKGPQQSRCTTRRGWRQRIRRTVPDSSPCRPG